MRSAASPTWRRRPSPPSPRGSPRPWSPRRSAFSRPYPQSWPTTASPTTSIASPYASRASWRSSPTSCSGRRRQGSPARTKRRGPEDRARAPSDERDQHRPLCGRDAGAARDFHGHRAARESGRDRSSERGQILAAAGLAARGDRAARSVPDAARARQGQGGRARGDGRAARGRVAREAEEEPRSAGGDLRGQGRTLRGGPESDGRAAAAEHPSRRAAGEARHPVSYAIPADEPGGVAPAALSMLVHGLLFAVLVFGLRWQSKRPDPVVAELWSDLPAIEQAEPKVEPKPEVKPQPKPEPRVEQKQPKPDIAIEREKKKAKKEEPPLKCDMTQRLREQLAQEQQALNRTRERQEALKQLSSHALPVGDPRYIEKIRARIWANIIPPADIKGNPEAIFDVVQLPTGEVFSARLRKSSGSKDYDEAVERAILKSSPLPKPDRPDQFQRELTLKFRPRE